MPYTNVQFIGYSIDTAPRDNVDRTETYLGLLGTRLDPEKAHQGLPNPQFARDTQARCELMTRAIHTALANLPQASPPEAAGTTLKVFLAPEFFFRGPDGAYPMDDVQVVIATLQHIAADEQWADWVFGFGTILGTSAPAVGSPPEIDPNAMKEVYNFTLIQKGGVASQGDAGARVIMKELMSGIDFIKQDANPGGILLGEIEPLELSEAGGPGREQQSVNYDGAGIFDLDGITWGVDICLDHLVGRLQRSPQVPGASEVQIELVPSCGANINPNNVIAAPGGYVFNVDGHNGSHAKLQRVVPPPTTVTSCKSYPVDGSNIVLADISPAEEVAINQLYRNGAGQVVIYDAVPVPAPSKVQGTIKTLRWQASADYQLKFDLIYDALGVFKTLLCEVVSSKTNFEKKNYFLPLALKTWSKSAVRNGAPDPDVKISVGSSPGSGSFDCAVWCKIDVPGFDFEGNAFQFNKRADADPPETIWKTATLANGAQPSATSAEVSRGGTRPPKVGFGG
jgi:hypothetical protein